MEIMEKELIDTILNCKECYGKGMVNGWVSPDGDYDFDWCDCNPEHLVPNLDQEKKINDTTTTANPVRCSCVCNFGSVI